MQVKEPYGSFTVYMITCRLSSCKTGVYNVHLLIILEPGVVGRSEACPLGMQAPPSSIPTSGTFFRGDLVMQIFFTAILPFR